MQDVITWIVEHRDDLWTLVELVLAGATVVTGLTRSPRDDRFVSRLRALLGRFSLVTHRDAAGSLKWPFTEADGPRNAK